jgi:hypothetical protein
VARISRSHTVLSRTTRSEEAGVQFPVSESSFVFVLPRCVPVCVRDIGEPTNHGVSFCSSFRTLKVPVDHKATSLDLLGSSRSCERFKTEINKAQATKQQTFLTLRRRFHVPKMALSAVAASMNDILGCEQHPE